ncbi:unnamed protein product, partial [Cyprideis torosa]
MTSRENREGASSCSVSQEHLFFSRLIISKRKACLSPPAQAPCCFA